MTSDTTHRLPLMVRLGDACGRGTLIGVPMAFLVFVFLLPFLVVIKISLSEMDEVVFKDLVVWADGVIDIRLKLIEKSYSAFIDDYMGDAPPEHRASMYHFSWGPNHNHPHASANVLSHSGAVGSAAARYSWMRPEAMAAQ